VGQDKARKRLSRASGPMLTRWGVDWGRYACWISFCVGVEELVLPGEVVGGRECAKFPEKLAPDGKDS